MLTHIYILLLHFKGIGYDRKSALKIRLDFTIETRSLLNFNLPISFNLE